MATRSNWGYAWRWAPRTSICFAAGFVAGFGVTAVGVLLGAAGALGLTRLLGNLPVPVESTRNPLPFGSAFAVMTSASLARVLAALRAPDRSRPRVAD